MSRQRVLVVDNDVRGLKLLEGWLCKAGFSVVTATDERNARELVDEHLPDLVITQTQGPEVDGLQLCRHIQQSSETSGTPVMFIAPDNSQSTRIRAVAAGATDYLVKPIYLDDLVRRAEILLEERRDLQRSQSNETPEFSADLKEIDLLDLFQHLNAQRCSGTLKLSPRSYRDGALYWRDGEIIDAHMAQQRGETALLRLLTQTEGRFTFVTHPIEHATNLTQSIDDWIAIGQQRREQRHSLLEHLPPLDCVLDIHEERFSSPDAIEPAELESITALLREQRTLEEVLAECSVDEIVTLDILCELFSDARITAQPGPARPQPSPTNPVGSEYFNETDLGKIAPIGTPAETIFENLQQLTPLDRVETLELGDIDQLIPENELERMDPESLFAAITTLADEPEVSESGLDAHSIPAGRTSPRPARVQKRSPSRHKGASGPKTKTKSGIMTGLLILVSVGALSWFWLVTDNASSEPDATTSTLDVASKSQRARALMTRGESLYHTRKLSEAIALFEKALVIEPANADFQTTMGAACFENREYQRALRHLNRSLTLNKEQAKVFVILGNVHQAMQQTAQARDAYEHYIKLEPQGPHAADVKRILNKL